LKKPLYGKEEDEADRANKIYVNLQALGVNTDAVKECCRGLDDLKDFCDRVIELLDKHKRNTPSIAL
jgi:hypothetical protein